MPPIADTGFVFAVVNSADQHHASCRELYERELAIYLPHSVLIESSFFISSRLGNKATAQFLAALPNPKYLLEPLADEDIRRVSAILDKYADSRVDFVDASVVAVAERLHESRVFTLDRRDFSLVRPTHTAQLTLLP